jgi:hypothetical protein
MAGSSSQTGNTICLPSRAVFLAMANSFLQSFSSSNSHSSRHNFRGFSVRRSHGGNVEMQMEGMAKFEQVEVKSGELEITEKVDCSFCSM